MFEHELTRKGFRLNSVKNYCGCLTIFLTHFKNKDSAKHISEKDIKKFLSQFKEHNTQRSFIKYYATKAKLNKRVYPHLQFIINKEKQLLTA